MSEGTIPGNGVEHVGELSQDGDRADEALGVRMHRVVEQRVDVGFLHHLTGVHDRDPIGHLGHDAQIVGDEDDRGAGRFLQVSHEIEDLGLDRHVEGSGRLVGDQELRLTGQRHGDHDPLGHASGQLVRIRQSPGLGVGDADPLEHLDDLLLLDVVRPVAVEFEDLFDLHAGPLDRIERRGRLLEDHRDLLAAQRPHLVLLHGGEVPAVEEDLAGDDLAGVGDQSHDRQGGDRLAAARLADDPEHLAPIDV